MINHYKRKYHYTDIQLNQQLFVPLKKRCKTRATGLIFFKLVLIDRGNQHYPWEKEIFPKLKKGKNKEEEAKMAEFYFRYFFSN